MRNLLFALIIVGMELSTIRGANAESISPKVDWDVTRPLGQARQIDFHAEEGTWMSVDLSPDGKTMYVESARNDKDPMIIVFTKDE